MKTPTKWIVLFSLGIFTCAFAHSGKVTKGFKAPYGFPTGLTFDGKNLWLSDYKADKLICLDPKTGETVKEIPSPGFWPVGLAWDGEALWNIDAAQQKIFRVDPSYGTILQTIDAPGRNPKGLAWDGETLWVSDPRGQKIMKIDLTDGTAVQSFPAPARNAEGLTYDGTYLWCADRILDEIHMIDPKNGEVIIILKSPGPYPGGLAWDGNTLWNVDYETDSLYQLIRQDDDLYKLDDLRKARVTLTHEVKITGKGQLQDLNVYFAVPENLPQQKILNKTFSPGNYQLVKDRWNQKFVHFHAQDVASEATLSSIMVVDAEISEISYFIFPDRCGTLDDIPKEIKKRYTANGTKYKTDDPYIQKLAKEIAGDEKNPYWIARKFFDHVRNTLEYKMEGGWNTAPVVLKRGTGSCSEYTFSFVALCRAAGLPARYVGAIVVRGDDASLDESFHRWPEVYLPNYGWIPIDPQGGDKSLPRDRARNIGQLPNRFLITTQGGGDSEYMGWYYNSYETYQTDPKVQVNIETFGEWDPLKAE